MFRSIKNAALLPMRRNETVSETAHPSLHPHAVVLRTPPMMRHQPASLFCDHATAPNAEHCLAPSPHSISNSQQPTATANSNSQQQQPTAKANSKGKQQRQTAKANSKGK
ncbi:MULTISPECIES: hypothetical protein, partial [unclassified Xanthomonas]